MSTKPSVASSKWSEKIIPNLQKKYVFKNEKVCTEPVSIPRKLIYVFRCSKRPPYGQKSRIQIEHDAGQCFECLRWPNKRKCSKILKRTEAELSKRSPISRIDVTHKVVTHYRLLLTKALLRLAIVPRCRLLIRTEVELIEGRTKNRTNVTYKVVTHHGFSLIKAALMSLKFLEYSGPKPPTRLREAVTHKLVTQRAATQKAITYKCVTQRVDTQKVITYKVVTQKAVTDRNLIRDTLQRSLVHFDALVHCQCQPVYHEADTNKGTTQNSLMRKALLMRLKNQFATNSPVTHEAVTHKSLIEKEPNHCSELTKK